MAERLTAHLDGSPVHVDCFDVLESIPNLHNFTEEQKNDIYKALQFSWNRGYKKGYAESSKDTQ